MNVGEENTGEEKSFCRPPKAPLACCLLEIRCWFWWCSKTGVEQIQHRGCIKIPVSTRELSGHVIRKITWFLFKVSFLAKLPA